MLYLAPSEVLEDVIDVLWNITRVITRQVCHGPPYLRHRTHFKLERAFCRSIIFKVQNMKAWKAEGVEHDCSRGDRESERREKEIGGKSFRGRAKVCFVPCVPLSLDTASTSLADIRASPSSVIASTSLSGSGLTVVSAAHVLFLWSARSQRSVMGTSIFGEGHLHKASSSINNESKRWLDGSIINLPSCLYLVGRWHRSCPAQCAPCDACERQQGCAERFRK